MAKPQGVTSCAQWTTPLPVLQGARKLLHPGNNPQSLSQFARYLQKRGRWPQERHTSSDLLQAAHRVWRVQKQLGLGLQLYWLGRGSPGVTLLQWSRLLLLACNAVGLHHS